MSGSKGWTMVEILIAVAIVMVVAAITFALAVPIKSATNNATCFHHFRNIYQSMALYRAEHTLESAFVGDLNQLGFPHDIANITRPGRAYFGTWEDWTCPAPKRAGRENTWPAYEYILLSAQNQSGSKYVSDLTSKFGGQLPLITDLNHNNHVTNDIFAPRVRKRFLYVSLEGQAKSGATSRTFVVVGSYWAYGFALDHEEHP